MKLFATTAAFAAALTTVVSGFSCQQLHASRTATSQLMMSSSESSRRDILSSAVSVAALGISALVIDPNTAAAASLRTGSITEQSAANKAAESYQGVYSDPNHPDGYRVIMASGKGATMTLSDGGSGDETYKNIPVGVNGNELSFDFGFSKYFMHIMCAEFLPLLVFLHRTNSLNMNLKYLHEQRKRAVLKAL